MLVQAAHRQMSQQFLMYVHGGPEKKQKVRVSLGKSVPLWLALILIVGSVTLKSFRKLLRNLNVFLLFLRLFSLLYPVFSIELLTVEVFKASLHQNHIH